MLGHRGAFGWVMGKVSGWWGGNHLHSSKGYLRVLFGLFFHGLQLLSIILYTTKTRVAF